MRRKRNKPINRDQKGWVLKYSDNNRSRFKNRMYVYSLVKDTYGTPIVNVERSLGDAKVWERCLSYAIAAAEKAVLMGRDYNTGICEVTSYARELREHYDTRWFAETWEHTIYSVDSIDKIVTLKFTNKNNGYSTREEALDTVKKQLIKFKKTADENVESALERRRNTMKKLEEASITLFGKEFNELST